MRSLTLSNEVDVSSLLFLVSFLSSSPPPVFEGLYRAFIDIFYIVTTLLHSLKVFYRDRNIINQSEYGIYYRSMNRNYVVFNILNRLIDN